MKRSIKLIPIILVGVLLLGTAVYLVAVPTTLNDFFLPGSQPGQSGNLETPNKCDNCHGGYDKAVEPAFNWRGSMMAQAMRDPLYFASVAIANQDATDAGDLCIRCHAPDGWLNGRSVPTDGSILNNNDYQGVQCDFCHKLVKPSDLGVNPFPEDEDYAAFTYDADQSYLNSLTIIPPQSGNGMYIVHDANAKRGPFVDAEAKHQMNYSPFHSESDICGTCHDVSNPAFVRNPDGTYAANEMDTPSPDFDTYTMFPVERTFSEWKMSSYNTSEGIYNPVMGGNKEYVSTCQDCHMRDVSGYGANKRRIPFRHNLPLHDMTGGNTFVPELVAQLYPDDVDHEALREGVERARFMLNNAATLQVVPEGNEGSYTGAKVTITNETGHKLPSGYPEGRRMWLQVKAYLNDVLVFQSGAYDELTAELSKYELQYVNGEPNMLATPSKIYEAKLGMSEDIEIASGLTNDADGSSFHFVLNNKVVKDNRIPPRGFTNANFEAIQSPPVNYSYNDGQYSDETVYTFPENVVANRIEVKLLYQTTSKEYVTFLRDENVTNDAGDLMYSLWENNGKSTPVVMEEETIGDGGTTEPEDILVFVDGITFETTTIATKGGKTELTATVMVVDEFGQAVSGANVSGQFSGPTNTNVQGNTDSNGIVEFTTSSKKVNSPWCLGITDIDKEGYEFTTNVQFCDEEVSGRMEYVNSEIKIYPNPTENLTHISLGGNKETEVTVEVFSIHGALIQTLHKGKLNGDKAKISWNTNQLKPGNYIVKITYPNKTESKIVHVY